MTDGETRGIVLQKIYDQRHDRGGYATIPLPGFETTADRNRLDNICRQLAEHHLIKFKETVAGGGLACITADGVDVVEGRKSSPITVIFNDHSISVSGSQNQIGNSNVQTTTNVQFDRIKIAIDSANAPDSEKVEAKGILEKITSNPLLVSIIGSILSGGGPAQ